MHFISNYEIASLKSSSGTCTPQQEKVKEKMRKQNIGRVKREKRWRKAQRCENVMCVSSVPPKRPITNLYLYLPCE